MYREKISSSLLSDRVFSYYILIFTLILRPEFLAIPDRALQVYVQQSNQPWIVLLSYSTLRQVSYPVRLLFQLPALTSCILLIKIYCIQNITYKWNQRTVIIKE